MLYQDADSSVHGHRWKRRCEVIRVPVPAQDNAWAWMPAAVTAKEVDDWAGFIWNAEVKLVRTMKQRAA